MLGESFWRRGNKIRVGQFYSVVNPAEEGGRQHQGMDRPGVGQIPEGSGEQGKMEQTVREVICGAPATLSVKG